MLIPTSPPEYSLHINSTENGCMYSLHHLSCSALNIGGYQKRYCFNLLVFALVLRFPQSLSQPKSCPLRNDIVLSFCCFPFHLVHKHHTFLFTKVFYCNDRRVIVILFLQILVPTH